MAGHVRTLGTSSADAIAASTYADERAPIELEVPTALVVLQGGWSFADPGNPMIIGLEQPIEAFAAWYEAHAPADLCEMYGLPRRGLPGEDLPPWELPWLDRPTGRRPPPGELDLGPEHGVSYYGPVSPEKVALERERLHSLRSSIQRSGYQPSTRSGHINGQLLVSGDRYRFLVRGGKHRAAVLASLGRAHLPVRFRPSWPRLTDRRDAESWSLVCSGEIHVDVARGAFDGSFTERSATDDHSTTAERTMT